MTIFGKGNNTRIIVSDLDNQFNIIDLIEEKGKDVGFTVIHQNLDGKIIRELKRREK